MAILEAMAMRCREKEDLGLSSLTCFLFKVSFESERTKLDLNDEVYDYVLEEIRSKAR